MILKLAKTSGKPANVLPPVISIFTLPITVSFFPGSAMKTTPRLQKFSENAFRIDGSSCRCTRHSDRRRQHSLYYPADSGKEKRKQIMRNIKIAALQFSCCSQVQENIDKAETMVREAASNGANLILLPELFERPYFCQEKRYDYYDYACL